GLQRWLPVMERWANDVFDGHERDAEEEHDRLKILADISALSQMTALLRYDPTIARGELRQTLAIQQRLLRMVPLLSAIGDRITGLGAEEREALIPGLAEARAGLAAGAPPEGGLADRVRHLPIGTGQERPWHQLVHDALAAMLVEVLTLWNEGKRIDSALMGEARLDRDLARSV